MNTKNKFILATISILALVASFFSGAFYTEKNYLTVSRLAIVTNVMRDDAVLTQIESGDIEKAKKYQTEYLKFNLLSLEVIEGERPENIKGIIEKRKNLLSK